MSDPDVEPPVTTLAHEVSSDVNCRKCGYNLRGLSTDGRCPECGTSVGFSTQGDYLRFSDPEWVDSLRRGVILILAGIGIMVLGHVANAAIGSMRVGAGLMALIPAILSLGASVLNVTGAWFLTRPDPSGLGEDRYGTSRKIIRITLAVSVIGALLSFIQLSGSDLPARAWTFIVLILLLVQLGGLVGQIAMLRYLSQLSLRIPDQKLSARAMFLMWAIGITHGIIVVSSTLLLFSIYTGGISTIGVAMAPLGCVSGIAGLGLIIFGILYLLMLDRFRVALRTAVENARSTWAARGIVPAPGS